MATTSSSVYTAQIGAGGSSVNAAAAFPLGKNVKGKLRIIQVPYVMTGSEATNDLLNVCKLRNGDRVLPSYCKITGEALGTAVTVSFGDATSASKYSGTLTVTAIHDLFFSSVAGGNAYAPADVVDPASTDQSIVVMKFVGVTTPTAAKKALIQIAIVSE